MSQHYNLMFSNGIYQIILVKIRLRLRCSFIDPPWEKFAGNTAVLREITGSRVNMCRAPYLPLSTIRTFFHWVFPTFGVWQNKILCLSQTNMRSRTNLLMDTWVKFLRLLFLHTVESKSIRLSETDCQSDIVGMAEG